MGKKTTKKQPTNHTNSTNATFDRIKKSKILIYACNWVEYNPKDSPNQALDESIGIPIIRVMCAARVNRQMLIEPIREGYEGILILSCTSEECRHEGGDVLAHNRVKATAALVGNLGINPQRIKFQSVKRGNHSEIIAAINEFKKEIAELG